jgi:hypothetical protein
MSWLNHPGSSIGECILQLPFLISASKSPYPSPLFVTTAFLPFGSPTSVLPLTLMGTMLYTHLAIRKLLTSQIHTAIPMLTVMNRVGSKTRSAIPIQNRENTAAVIRDRRSVPTVKEAKSRRGVAQRRIWTPRKVCTLH